METILKIINTLAWIALFYCPFVISLKVYFAFEYEDSKEQLKDRLQKREKNYLHKMSRYILGFILAVVVLFF